MTNPSVVDMLPFFLEKKRLNTFKKWPFGNSSRCNPQSMVDAGWFAVEGIGAHDLAQCMSCGKELDGWEDTDDPWEEHSRRCPTCPYVIVNKKQSDWTLGDFLAFSREAMNCQLTTDKDKKISRLNELYEEYEQKKLGNRHRRK